MLDNTTATPSFDSLETQFRGRIGRNIVHMRTTSSTMEDARELVKLAEDIGELHGTVIIADQQTRGRGRFGRSWDSNPGKDILLSLIVCPRPSIAPQLTIMASLATRVGSRSIDRFNRHNQVAQRCLGRWQEDMRRHRRRFNDRRKLRRDTGNRTERKFTTRGRCVQDLPSHQHPRNRDPQSSHQSHRRAARTLGKPQRALHRHR